MTNLTHPSSFSFFRSVVISVVSSFFSSLRSYFCSGEALRILFWSLVRLVIKSSNFSCISDLSFIRSSILVKEYTSSAPFAE